VTLYLCTFTQNSHIGIKIEQVCCIMNTLHGTLDKKHIRRCHRMLIKICIFSPFLSNDSGTVPFRDFLDLEVWIYSSKKPQQKLPTVQHKKEPR
jgi:hypothetical protein